MIEEKKVTNLDQATEFKGIFPAFGCGALVQNRYVGRDRAYKKGTIDTPNTNVVPHETYNCRALPEIPKKEGTNLKQSTGKHFQAFQQVLTMNPALPWFFGEGADHSRLQLDGTTRLKRYLGQLPTYSVPCSSIKTAPCALIRDKTIKQRLQSNASALCIQKMKFSTSCSTFCCPVEQSKARCNLC